MRHIYFCAPEMCTVTAPTMRPQWWGCSVTGAVKGERDDCGRPVFTLHYDAFEAFEEAHHQVAFIDGYRLVHLEDGAEMTWKMEGQEVDREALMASLSDEPVDLQEVSADGPSRLCSHRSVCPGPGGWSPPSAARRALVDHPPKVTDSVARRPSWQADDSKIYMYTKCLPSHHRSPLPSGNSRAGGATRQKYCGTWSGARTLI